ncbi:zinc finger MYM-type protein 5-like [Hydra vulgaris]|uniref:Zinc finger MYM-type protein 5-like n=1 Tax=Hydra vulgaris TaxID=6087 RepID=A0ABM4DC32_HYDVU
MTIIELTQLETYVDDLMQFYHAKWPQGSVPPKLHMMEDHAIPFLQKWGAGFGFYGEQGETNISRPSSDLQDEDAVLKLQPISLIDHNDIITNVENKNVESTNVENTCTTNVEIENIVINLPSITPNVNIIPQEIMLNYNDPNSWPAISNNVIYSLVNHGPEQGNNVNVNTIISADNTGRKFTKDWFYVKHINGEMVIRKWLLYSINQNAIFCFPCILFGHKSYNITDPHKGFRDWRHLHPVIPQHENSSDHRNNYVKWKVMETNIRSGNTLDDYLINSINEEKMACYSINEEKLA